MGGSIADTGIHEIPRSLKEIASSARVKGYKVTKHNQASLDLMDSAHNDYRKKADKRLNELWVRGAGTPRKGWKGH